MKNCCYKKGLVLIIIVLFIGVSVFSSVSSKNLSISDEEILEYDSEIDDNDVIKPVDEYTEIFTHIRVQTDHYSELKYTEIGEGFFRHVEIWIDSGSITGTGIRREFPWFFSKGYGHHLILPKCHIYIYISWPTSAYVLGAVAKGNIYG